MYNLYIGISIKNDAMQLKQEFKQCWETQKIEILCSSYSYIDFKTMMLIVQMYLKLYKHDNKFYTT